MANNDGGVEVAFLVQDTSWAEEMARKGDTLVTDNS